MRGNTPSSRLSAPASRVCTAPPLVSASAPLDRPDETPPAPKPRARTALSFELIPPRHGADAARLDELIAGLSAYNPDYVSVTSSRRSDWLAGTAALAGVTALPDGRTVAFDILVHGFDGADALEARAAVDAVAAEIVETD